MKAKINSTISIITGVFWLMTLDTSSGITNSVPWSDSFETYTNGMSISGTNGWGSDPLLGSVITTAPEVTDLLTNYPVAGRSYPLSLATHTSVLQVATLMSNTTHSASGGVVSVDFMVMPDWMPVMPVGDAGAKFALCVSTNGRLTIWHHNTVASPATNQWLELANSPVIPSNVWARFTILQDHSNRLFQVRINEAAPVSDNLGWTAGGVAQNGTWFHMVQTNPAMSQWVVAGVSTYVDDVVVNKRVMTWSGTNFTERTINDGAIDGSTPILITLVGDTFRGEIGNDLVAQNKMTVVGLPSNLTAVAEMTSLTSASMTLTGKALVHEAVNSTNLTIQFTDEAFTLGSGWDVSGSRTNAQLAFLDTPVMAYGTNHFNESGANNGAIDNSSPILITLTNGTFSGAVNEDFATNHAKLVIGQLPVGLTGEVMYVSATQLCFRLLGQATRSDVADNVSDLTLTFQDGAFNSVPASSVFNKSDVFSISFTDSSTLTYGTPVFTEMSANNGAVNGTTLTLVNKSFDAAEGVDLVAGGKVSYTNLPAGLGLQIVRGATAQQATLIFTGTANAHSAGNSLFNFGITFRDTAFVGGNAAAVADATRSNLQVLFTDPRTLSYNGSSFTELSAGLIDNRAPITITLAGDVLTGANGEDFVAAHKITAGNVPAGLTAQITRTSATQLSIQLVGVALSHTSAASVATVSFTFHDEAFTAGNAIYVVNYQKTGVVVTFIDDLGFFNVVPYVEPFETYTPGLQLAGTNGWSALYHSDACMVTNDGAVTTKLLEYTNSHLSFPATATHTQVLFVQDYIETAVHSEGAGLVYLDFMTIPEPLQAAPDVDTNRQFAFYVSTNGQLAIWHRDMTGGSPVNQWLTLASAPLITTSTWVRFSVAQDYRNHMFQMRVNEGAPISDPAGWSQPSGGARPGSWFHMVKTNGIMSAFGISGLGAGYLDDLTVRTRLPDFCQVGSVFVIR